jgi:TonB-linked SusC/RagA family outer membrane protein
MKKNYYGNAPFYINMGLKKLLLTMRITLILSLCCILNLSASLNSSSQTFNLTLTDVKVKEVFKVIEGQSNFRFFYNDELSDVNRLVSLNVKNSDVNEILSQLLDQSLLSYRVLDNNLIVIAPKETLQQVKVSGTITDGQTGEPLPGVNIIIEGTTIGVTSDINGKYTIELPNQNAVLVFSYIGYLVERVQFTGQSSIDIKLMPDIKTLDEVVVVGYGTAKKSDVTGALTRVTEKTIQERPVQNMIQALQGKASGIDVTSNIKPGELPQITIRGTRSIKASNTPLYVIDGIPVVTGLPSNVTSNNPIDVAYNNPDAVASINPNDIASIEILKDASATAIYGSRGANGVILITTKKGTKGKVSINYDGTTSFDSYKSLTDWMNGGEYIDRWRLALMNGGQYGTEKFTNFWTPVKIGYPDPTIDRNKFGLASDPTAYESVMMGYEWVDRIGGTVRKRLTNDEERALGWPDSVPVYNSNNIRSYDWRKQSLRQGITQNHQISLSSGTDISRLYMSFGYLDQIGVQKDQDYKRYSGSINGDISPSKWLTFGTSTNASLAVQNFGIIGVNTSNTGSKDLYSRANDQFPYALPKDANGNWIRNPGANLSLWNPLIDIDQSINERRISTIFTNMFTEVKFTSFLKYRLNFGIQYRHFRNGSWTGPNATSHLSSKPNTSGYNTNQSFAWVTENLLYFDKTFANIHTIGLTLLHSAQKYREEGINVGASNMIYDISEWYDVAANSLGKPDSYGTSFTQNTLMSYMARANYSLLDKYLLTASGRWDGSSVLAPGHKWDFFPSFAIAWKMQEESFINSVSWINELKLRLGYGVTGNSSVPPYTTTGPLSRNPYVFGSAAAVGYLPQTPSNPVLGWEKTAQWNIGLDYSFFQNRISGTVEVYQANTSDLLLNKTLPAVSGFVNMAANVGKTKNQGIEITLSTVNVQTKNFRWTTDINWTTNKEEIVELINGKQDMLADRLFIGQPVQVYYNYKNLGIWQNTSADSSEMAKFNANGHRFYPGTIKVFDKNNDYRITGDDMVILGTNRPKWSGGITNTLKYKNWEMSFFAIARIGQTYFGGYPNSYGGIWPNGRVENDIWSWSNPGGYWPMPNSGNVENITPAMNYNEGSYVIIRNISLSYSFPQTILNKIRMNKLQIFGQVLNPFIFGGDVVKWGINPEDNVNWDRVSGNGGPLGGMNNNTILPQSFVIGVRAGL